MVSVRVVCGDFRQYNASCPTNCTTPGQQCTSAELSTLTFTNLDPLGVCRRDFWGGNSELSMCSTDGSLYLYLYFTGTDCVSVDTVATYRMGICSGHGISQCQPSNVTWPRLPTGPQGLGSVRYYGDGDTNCEGNSYETEFYPVGVCVFAQNRAGKALLQCIDGVATFNEYKGSDTSCTGPPNLGTMRGGVRSGECVQSTTFGVSYTVWCHDEYGSTGSPPLRVTSSSSTGDVTKDGSPPISSSTADSSCPDWECTARLAARVQYVGAVCCAFVWAAARLFD